MSNFIDKCYHVACAIPRAQTVIGVSFAIKDIVGIIKDIAMNTLFKGYLDSVNTTLHNMNETDTLLRKMFEQNNDLYILGSKSNLLVNSRSSAIMQMNIIYLDLEEMNLLMPVSDFTSLLYQEEKDSLIKTKAFTDARIEAAILENDKRMNDLKLISFFVETVPAKKRLYNLATAVISSIPVVGTVYNVGALGYFCFIKP